jgi:hypothetical protein
MVDQHEQGGFETGSYSLSDETGSLQCLSTPSDTWRKTFFTNVDRANKAVRLAACVPRVNHRVSASTASVPFGMMISGTESRGCCRYCTDTSGAT